MPYTHTRLYAQLMEENVAALFQRGREIRLSVKKEKNVQVLFFFRGRTLWLNSSHTVVWGINLNHKLPGNIWVNQVQMKIFQVGECLVSLWGPAELGFHRCQVVQGGSHRAVVFNEYAVEVSEPQKPLHLCAVFWSRPLSWQGPPLCYWQILWIQGKRQTSCLCFHIATLEGCTGMVGALCLWTTEEQYIIQVDKERFIDHVSQDVIDQVLEDHWSADEAKRHYQVFIVSRWSVECYRMCTRWSALWSSSLVKY